MSGHVVLYGVGYLIAMGFVDAALPAGKIKTEEVWAVLLAPLMAWVIIGIRIGQWMERR